MPSEYDIIVVGGGHAAELGSGKESGEAGSGMERESGKESGEAGSGKEFAFRLRIHEDE